MNLDYDILTPEEESKMFLDRIKNREAIIKCNLKLVYHIANNLDYGNEDLVSEGIIGLLKAINNFDTELGLKFSTFAYHSIKYSMLDYFKKIEYFESLDEEAFEDVSKLDLLISDTNIEEAFEAVDTLKHRRILIKKELTKLPDKDRIVFERYLSGKNVLELKAEFNISKEKVIQILNKVERFLTNIFKYG